MYVEHQIEVVTRRSQYRLKKAKEREHIVEGLVKALDMIDAVVATIRRSADADDARTELMTKPFEFTEVQANSFARPEDGVANAVRQIDFAGFGDALQTGVAVIEVGVMPANYPVAQRLKTEIVEIFHASRNHRVRIDTGDPRAELRGLGGARRHESEIFANFSPCPKRFGQNLGSTQGG